MVFVGALKRHDFIFVFVGLHANSALVIGKRVFLQAENALGEDAFQAPALTALSEAGLELVVGGVAEDDRQKDD